MDPDSKRLTLASGPDHGRRGARATAGLRVSVSDGRGRRVRDGGLSRWLETAAPARSRGEVAIALVTDAHITRLNRHYRRRAAPTDVLSFPSAPPTRDGGSRGRPSASRVADPASPQGRRHLGDLVIATGVARRQAREAGHSYATELRVLALHGLLHLLGYDHDARGDAGRMARAEARLRRRAGLPAGVIERAGASRRSASGRARRPRRKARR